MSRASAVPGQHGASVGELRAGESWAYPDSYGTLAEAEPPMEAGKCIDKLSNGALCGADTETLRCDEHRKIRNADASARTRKLYNLRQG